MLHFNVEDLTSEGVCVRENSYLSSRATVFSLSLSFTLLSFFPWARPFVLLAHFQANCYGVQKRCSCTSVNTCIQIMIH